MGNIFSYLEKELTIFFSALEKFIQLGVHNKGLAYGLSIIVFTAIIRIILLPLNLKQMHSSIRMQDLQPEVQKLQKKYKDNPQKMQELMMKLYKENNASPLSGCLPVLVQWPILMALYWVFKGLPGIDKVGFLWIKSLGKTDQFYILPILSGATTFLSTYIMTPKTNGKENKQANLQTNSMNIFMTIFITYISFTVNNSALVLYWVTQNLFQLGQVVIQRKLMKKGDVVPLEEIERNFQSSGAGLSGKKLADEYRNEKKNIASSNSNKKNINVQNKSGKKKKNANSNRP